jgi:hypothetical protein
MFPTINVTNTQYVQLDMMVDVYNGNTLVAADRKILDFNEEAKTISLSGASFTLTAGYTLHRTNSRNKEWTGLSKIISNAGSLYNLDPAVEPVWKAVVNTSGSARAISETLMILLHTRIKKNGGKTTAVFTTPGVWNSYWALLSQQRQFVNTTKFEGGFSGLAFITPDGEIPVVQDFDCPTGKMYYLNEKDLKVYREHDWKWMNRDGNMFQRKITANGRFDAYEATMYQYSELGVHRRNTHGVIDNITELV